MSVNSSLLATVATFSSSIAFIVESTAAIALAPTTPLIPLINRPSSTELELLTITRLVSTDAESPNPNETYAPFTALTGPLNVS